VKNDVVDIIIIMLHQIYTFRLILSSQVDYQIFLKHRTSSVSSILFRAHEGIGLKKKMITNIISTIGYKGKNLKQVSLRM
jgi:hypothetical protein